LGHCQSAPLNIKNDLNFNANADEIAKEIMHPIKYADYDLMVVGDGLGARLFLFFLAQKQYSGKILQIFQNEQFPPCSLNTTAMVSDLGVEKGVSAHGDLLLQSYDCFIQFQKKYQLKGVEKVKQIKILTETDDAEQFLRRYKMTGPIAFKNKTLEATVNHEAYIISPELFLNELKKCYQSLNLTCQVSPFTFDQNEKYPSLYLFAGAFPSLHYKNFPDHQVYVKSQVVPGSYLIFNDIEWNGTSVVIGFSHFNVIYRRQDKILLLGGTTSKLSQTLPDVNALKIYYDLAKTYIDLPDFSRAKMQTGFRHKGFKRQTFCGALNPQKTIYGVSGTYKNGWSLLFHFAQELSELVKQ
jgi:hypothetical protein